jgi:colanic acid biosynthesis glycosyl transferase WcaI
MNFLILTQYFPPEIGAAPTRLEAVARELTKLGHHVEVVTAIPNYPHGRIFPEYKGSFYRREVREGTIVHRVWLYPTVGSGVARMLNYLSFSLLSAFGLLRCVKPDHLLVESPPPTLSLAAYICSRLWRVPFILNVADLWPETIFHMGLLKKGPVFRLLSLLERWSYRKATYLNAVTEGIRDALIGEKGVPPEKVFFLPNGVDTQRHMPQPPDCSLKEKLGLAGKRVILYSGTLGRAHGLEHVLEAAKLLEDQPEIHFLFLGDGSERPSLEKLQGHLGLHNVTFRGAVPLEQLAPYESIAEIGLVTLRDIPIFEGARPSKMFPLLAAGRPLLFCGNGEGARLVRRAQAGIVVPPENPKALAAAVTEFLGDADLIRRLGANGRRFVMENHQWSKLIGDWVADLQDRQLKSKTSKVRPPSTSAVSLPPHSNARTDVSN